ncbi:major facilitator superfamily MFS_1 [Thermobaculum terrenum ATCC BAA-798]|uniref:Major facilitator superfamily MFS_1 n=1 Tax=Thermobaculum terrenum (strain ATCC BAA-798 / CCMEE 7001 / YNP1) TaxID=525904 RepID=D1CI53_THET1|nr:MFS transporter [Thermobaculum terrenum]ACZ43424.1 major facilitator superfamily MFS_1 [Thermobaculum terrenum ATCC BAA-798]
MGGRVRALVLSTLAFTTCFAVWGLISPLAPTFRELYGLSGAQAGLLVALPVLLGSLLRLPLGILADRYGGRLVFTLLLLGLLLPVGLAGMTSSYATLLAVSLMLGVAGASFAVGAPFVAAWWPPDRQGLALGVYGMGNFGTAISSFLAPKLADSLGWRTTFWVHLPVLVVMAALFWLLGRDAPGRVVRVPSLRERLSVFRRRPISWVLALFYFVTFGGFVAISVYLPILLVSEYGLSRPDAGTRTAGFVAVATLARPIGGYLADRVGGAPILNATFLVVAAFAVVLAFLPGMPILTVAFLGIAGMLGLGNGAVFKLVSSYFPAETGTVTGLVGAAGGLGGFFPPLVMGVVHDVAGSYAIAFMLLSEFALLCLVVNILVIQHRASLLTPEEGEGSS